MSSLLYLRFTTRTDFINYCGLSVSIDGFHKKSHSELFYIILQSHSDKAVAVTLTKLAIGSAKGADGG